MKNILLMALLASGFVLTACAGAVAAQPAVVNPPATAIPTFATQALSIPTTAAEPVSASLTRVDEQGAVVVEVTPLNLEGASDVLEFDVAMNTHSVDLSMDLAGLAKLTTDSGVSVQALSWDAPGGGHHVGGKLTFQATKDGKPILQGATKLTLTILDVDAPTRTFEWQLP